MIIRRKNLLIISNLLFIIVGIVAVTAIDRVTATNNGSSDIRARAGITNHLTVNATVVSADALKGSITVTDLYFTDESRSGEAKNLGSWIVTTPATFNFSTVSAGTSVVIKVNASLFKISDHTLTAVSITPQR